MGDCVNNRARTRCTHSMLIHINKNKFKKESSRGTQYTTIKHAKRTEGYKFPHSFVILLTIINIIMEKMSHKYETNINIDQVER